MTVTSEDLRRVADGVLERFALLPDEAWDRPAFELAWTCRETAGHILDDLGGYALQLSGSRPPQDDYVELLEPPPLRAGGPRIIFYPDPAAGTRGILRCLDAAAGLLCSVVATADGKRGYHPMGISDAEGFAAMGIVEAAVHAFDILTVHQIPYAADASVCARVLDRLFPAAVRTGDPWQDLLGACGRTPATRGLPWRWDASVR
ncbi:DinB family protein [Arthrobacter sp. I2-34]|uniref:DinB family protein n=1 Tax=Arthrobacter hankyongi TaxID=2904801 RepID=A0ABS9L971_9MICC|nr:DinB family protein [Arthrobacter hankyongi]MCG2623224.1 DinB family protein [Arthrobacter hankyongi]